jgi:DNA (cytosine-5)-methyltransferase 1
MSFRFIDLFAGIGGIRIAFEEFGGECVFTSEWDKFAQQTYSANHGEVPSGDITQVQASDIPSFDLLLAGFPCQPFSHAGLKKGFEDTRGTLFFDIARIVKHHKPKALVLENVKGLFGHDKGNTFREILRILREELGYNVSFQILNAKHFGLPQNRARLVIVATDKSLKEFVFPEIKPVEAEVGQILEPNSTVDKKYTLSDQLWSSHVRRKEDHRLKGNGFGYSLFTAKSPYTSTISARYYKDGSEILISQRNKNPRKLTPREASRLQGFPESFRIPVSDTQAYKQFGNSVAIPMFGYIAKELAPMLGGSNRPKKWKPKRPPQDTSS